MAKIYQLPTQVPGTVDVFPNQKFCIFGDNLATVTTAGYLNQADLTAPLSPTDVILAFYDYDENTKSGTYGTFTVSVSNLGVITLTSVGVAGSGTVNTASINNLAYYAAAGDTVSGLSTANSSVLVTNGTGVPSLSTTLPDGLAMGTPASLTLTNADGLPLDGIIVGANSSMVATDSSGGAVALGAMANGEIIIGSTGATPVKTTLTAGSNVTITNSAGAITIAAGASSGFEWVDAPATTVAMEVNKGYIASNAGLTTLTLPAVAPVGSRVAVQDSGAGGWVIAQNAGQIMRTNSGESTVGVTGTMSSSQIFDVIYLLCVVENTEWVYNGGFGNYVFA